MKILGFAQSPTTFLGPPTTNLGLSLEAPSRQNFPKKHLLGLIQTQVWGEAYASIGLYIGAYADMPH